MIGMNGYPVGNGFIKKNVKSAPQPKSTGDKSFEEKGFENLLNARMGFTIERNADDAPSENLGLKSGLDNDADAMDPFQKTVPAEVDNTHIPFNINGLEPQNMKRLKNNSLSYNITSPVRRTANQYNDYNPRLGDEGVEKPKKKLYQLNQDPELVKGMQELNQTMADLKSALGNLF